ncbi:hypothetical protein ACFSJY_05115 [Thalassotalea euphylliae]|uniref:hypothetical protein n=1 Tax=Thalassotalea euphylliae TaxID=1655234 RepID=UPI00363A9885
MKKNSVKLLIYIVVVCLVAYLAINNSAHDEQDVFLSLVQTIKKNESSKQAAFYSYPTHCMQNVENIYELETGLWNSFLKANDYNKGPVQLFSLNGLANTVKWEDNLQIYDTEGGSKLFRSSNKDLIKLSRVGFNSSKEQALVCLESSWRGILFHLRKQDDSWVIVDEFQAWIS